MLGWLYLHGALCGIYHVKTNRIKKNMLDLISWVLSSRWIR